jgi:superfamily I DNA/RNA helicase
LEHSGYLALEDKVVTLLFLAKLSTNIEDLKVKIRTIFTDEIKGIVLSTIHKIKGLEASRVFIIRPDLLPMKTIKGWQQIQEKNLEYVAITRAKTELIYDKTWTDE